MRILLLSWWRLLTLYAAVAVAAWFLGRAGVSWHQVAVLLSLVVFGIWTSPKTWTAVVVTVVDLNTHIRDNLNLLKTSIADDGRISGEIKTVKEEISTVTISAGVATFDLSLSNNFKVTLNANITAIVFSNTGLSSTKAMTVTIRFTQDGTGGRTVAMPGSWHYSYGTAPVITPTASKSDVMVAYTDDGWVTTFASMFVVSG